MIHSDTRLPIRCRHRLCHPYPRLVRLNNAYQFLERLHRIPLSAKHNLPSHLPRLQYLCRLPSRLHPQFCPHVRQPGVQRRRH
ncbi:unnamed protein product [Chondrus crispus]|uniref:Uncharacterized protein n=1 Tax=Chondrus crispus TaxID=2769 RepID=R7QGT3_CHOCR|nr:unnamed protein product [Chondrus crispus]CDF37294.1 unnamed protein product [Chondrus crispus]|eukprot:XP_005717113.1 unnamed protein product [Chondrus crispus]